jgi:hypothetical protein
MKSMAHLAKKVKMGDFNSLTEFERMLMNAAFGDFMERELAKFKNRADVQAMIEEERGVIPPALPSQALRALDGLELDFVALAETAKAFGDDGRVVDEQLDISPSGGKIDKTAVIILGMENVPKRSWPAARRPARGKSKSHAELKRTSSIGYGTYRPSPPRGEGNIHFFGAAATSRTKKRPSRH